MQQMVAYVALTWCNVMYDNLTKKNKSHAKLNEWHIVDA